MFSEFHLPTRETRPSPYRIHGRPPHALASRLDCCRASFEISLFSLCYIQLVLSASQAANGCAAATYLQRLTFGAACGVHLGRPRMLEHRQLSHFRNFWARPRPAKIPPLRQLPSDRYCGSRKRGRRLLVQWHEQRSARSQTRLVKSAPANNLLASSNGSIRRS